MKKNAWLTIALWMLLFAMLLPMAACGLLFLWGLWLYLTSDSWMNAELIDLLRDYGLPFVGCCLSWFAYALYLRKKA